jgi:hypothetical protein
MYTLRTITEKNVTSNLYLGEHYKKYSSDHDEYDKMINDLVDKPYQDQVKCIILYDNSTQQVPVFNTNQNYIMSESGKTFEKL